MDDELKKGLEKSEVFDRIKGYVKDKAECPDDCCSCKYCSGISEAGYRYCTHKLKTFNMPLDQPAYQIHPECPFLNIDSDKRTQDKADCRLCDNFWIDKSYCTEPTIRRKINLTTERETPCRKFIPIKKITGKRTQREGG